MLCPIDNETLVMTDRNGVEIDYCPKCRGVWLDRGELDKIIERTAPPREARGAAPGRDERQRDERSRDEHRPKRRESFLGDLFDF